MKKPRILLALEKKLPCRQNEAKVKRIQKAIEVAKANAEEDLAQATDTLEDLMQNIDKDTDVQDIIQKISDAMYDADQAKEAIEQLDRVNNFLFEELEEPEDEK